MRSGGAIKADSVAALTATTTRFVGNVADGSSSSDGYGGAIHLVGGTPQLSFLDCELRSNNASSGGGGVYYEAEGGISANATRFEANWAKYNGGGIYAFGGVTQVGVVCGVCARSRGCFCSRASTALTPDQRDEVGPSQLAGPNDACSPPQQRPPVLQTDLGLLKNV